jgi:CheY-like chemotaxis protein
MIRAALLAPDDLEPDLRSTVLWRRNVERIPAAGVEDVRRQMEAARVDVVVVDPRLPNAAAVVSTLRQDALTRATAIVALGRSEFGFTHLDLLEAGANAILPLPPGQDWDDRLMRLINVPMRKAARFPVDLAIEGGLRTGQTFAARAHNLSVHGLLLECGESLDIGEDVCLAFEIPAGHGPARGTGTVVRAAPAGYFGVELTHVEGDGRLRIKRFVESGPSGLGGGGGV